MAIRKEQKVVALRDLQGGVNQGRRGEVLVVQSGWRDKYTVKFYDNATWSNNECVLADLTDEDIAMAG